MFEKVTDKDAALMTRQIVQQEGIWVGNSAGSALAGLIQLKDKLKETDVVVVIFHDHGTRYLGKIFNDEWMRKMGYLDKKGMTASDLVASRKNIELVTIEKTDTIGQALKLITEFNFSQIPVTSGDRIVGSIYENLVLNKIVENPESKNLTVESIMQEALPFADITTPIDALSKMITPEKSAVLVKDFKANRNYIITRFDIAEALAK